MNVKMTVIMKLARIELIIVPIFIFFKYIRPTILDSASPKFFKIILLSLPNFFEAVIGTLTLTGLLLIINDRLNKILPKFIYISAVVLTSFYVILQELNLITIRGNTTCDKNDLIFLLIGLILGYLIILYVKPRIRYE